MIKLDLKILLGMISLCIHPYVYLYYYRFAGNSRSVQRNSRAGIISVEWLNFNCERKGRTPRAHTHAHAQTWKLSYFYCILVLRRHEWDLGRPTGATRTILTDVSMSAWVCYPGRPKSSQCSVGFQWVKLCPVMCQVQHLLIANLWT
jgi:hypothetical protein